MKDYNLFLNKKDETWQQALERYHSFCEADMKDYFSNKEYSYRFIDNSAYKYHQEGKVSAQSIEDFTTKYNVKVPQELISLLQNYGSFRIGESIFEIYDDIGTDTILTLSQLLGVYGYDEFATRISESMLKSLDGYYFFFGVSFPHSDEISFLFFNKTGSFGKMLFAPKNQDLVLQKVLPSMFNGSIDKYTLDSLISNQIDRVITNALTVRGYIE